LGGYPCHFQHGTQALVLDSDGLVLLPQTGYKEPLAATPCAASVEALRGAPPKSVVRSFMVKRLGDAIAEPTVLGAS